MLLRVNIRAPEKRTEKRIKESAGATVLSLVKSENHQILTSEY